MIKYNICVDTDHHLQLHEVLGARAKTIAAKHEIWIYEEIRAIRSVPAWSVPVGPIPSEETAYKTACSRREDRAPRCTTWASLSNTQRGNGIGGKGSQNETQVLEPCWAEKNKGSNMQRGFLEPIAPLSLPLRGFAESSLSRHVEVMIMVVIIILLIVIVLVTVSIVAININNNTNNINLSNKYNNDNDTSSNNNSGSDNKQNI